MEEREERGGAVKVGMIWGGIGGFSCGRRAAVAGNRAGALSGLVGGAVAAPVYVLGSTLGALLAARQIGTAGIATTLSDMLDTQISADEAWIYFLFSLILSAILEAAILILVSSAAGAWAKRE